MKCWLPRFGPGSPASRTPRVTRGPERHASQSAPDRTPPPIKALHSNGCGVVHEHAPKPDDGLLSVRCFHGLCPGHPWGHPTDSHRGLRAERLPVLRCRGAPFESGESRFGQRPRCFPNCRHGHARLGLEPGSGDPCWRFPGLAHDSDPTSCSRHGPGRIHADRRLGRTDRPFAPSLTLVSLVPATRRRSAQRRLSLCGRRDLPRPSDLTRGRTGNTSSGCANERSAQSTVAAQIISRTRRIPPSPPLLASWNGVPWSGLQSSRSVPPGGCGIRVRAGSYWP